MVCGMMGELTKLCAYSFGFGFRYLFVEGERANGVAADHTHTHVSARCFSDCTLILILLMLCFEIQHYDFVMEYFIDKVLVKCLLNELVQKCNFWP